VEKKIFEHGLITLMAEPGCGRIRHKLHNNVKFFCAAMKSLTGI